MSKPETDDSDQQAIEILGKKGFIITEKGILRLTEGVYQSSITLFPWKKIKEINRVQSDNPRGNNYVGIHFWNQEETVAIDMTSCQTDIPLVYRFLAGKLMNYASRNISK